MQAPIGRHFAVDSPSGRVDAAVALGVAAGLLAVYQVFLWPDVPALGDSAKFQALAATLGTAHSPGAPLWILLAHVFGKVLPWGSPAHAANLLTALFSVAGTAFLFGSLRQLEVPRAAAAVGTLAFGLTPTLWSQSVVAEVYSLGYLFLAAETFLLLRWRRRVAEGDPRDTDLHLVLALYVLSFTNHPTALCLGPGILVFVLLVRRRSLWRPATLAVLALSAATALGVYSYVLWRSRSPSVPFLEMQAADLGDLLRQLVAEPRRRHIFQWDPAVVLGQRLPATLGRLGQEFLFLLPVALLGLGRKPRGVSSLLCLFALGNLAFALTFSVPDSFVYFLPVYFVVALLLGMGWDRLQGFFKHKRLLAAAGLLGALLLGAFQAPGLLQQKRFREAESRRLDLLFERIGDRPALLLSDRYDASMGLLYRSLLREPRITMHHLPPVSLELPLPLGPLRRYLSEDLPLRSRNYVRPLPPGLPVYCACGELERWQPHGIDARDLGGGLARLAPSVAAGPPPPEARLVYRLETVPDLVAALDRLRGDPQDPGSYSRALRLGRAAGVEERAGDAACF
ncbi:MAG: DUF2723 domain-containing protein, partial [Acidobacteria bacterium]|nr:DUF2723 domain-containing protein [Acidobacteriota bacterium]